MREFHNPILYLVLPPQFGMLKGCSGGLIALANYVHQRAPEVEIRIEDFESVPIDRLEDYVRRNTGSTDRLTLVGITVTTAGYQVGLQTARIFKRIYPKCVVLFGGPHATAQAQLILDRHPTEVDFIVVGEGEKSLLAFIQHYPDVERVPGLVFRSGEKVIVNSSAPRLTSAELDELPVTFCGAGLDPNPGKFGTVTYVSARGCPLPCAFCSVANEVIRCKSISQVREDLIELTLERGYRRIAIEDNFFAHSRRRTVELCRTIQELRRLTKIPFHWDCQTRVESLARDGIVEAMEDAGCEAVYIGVESLLTPYLAYLRKARDPDRYLRSLRQRVIPRLLCSQIATHMNLQLGLPGETLDDNRETLDSLRQIGQAAQRAGKTVTIFPQLHVVYPGTGHFSDGLVNCRFPIDVFETFTAWESDQKPILNWLGEHFAHGTGGLPEGILESNLLRHGEYEVRPSAVARIDDVLNQMTELPGIAVFKYGAHLVGRCAT